MVLLLPDLRDMEVGELAWDTWTANDVLCQDLPHSPLTEMLQNQTQYARPIPPLR